MLTFLHTAPMHVDTFDALLRELAPGMPVRHIVDEAVLREARDAGRLTEAIETRVRAQVHALRDAPVVLCTCSTIGGCAEAAGTNVIRVDRPMAERAVQIGRRIIVAATLSSTLEPTKALILDEARKQGRPVDVIEVLCEGAWAKLEAGDRAGHIEVIRQRLREVTSQGDVVVLAQASMADVARDAFDVPVLSSPRLGLEAALAAVRARFAPDAAPGMDRPSD